jgi:hypothetical protein
VKPAKKVRAVKMRFVRSSVASIAIACGLSIGIQGQAPESRPRGYSIPPVDLAGEEQRRVVVDREPEQHLGHPTTVLLEDGGTILTVYPKGHGKGPIVLKQSRDGGLTWSARESPRAHLVGDVL